jgi:hypothetical protein
LVTQLPLGDQSHVSGIQILTVIDDYGSLGSHVPGSSGVSNPHFVRCENGIECVIKGVPTAPGEPFVPANELIGALGTPIDALLRDAGMETMVASDEPDIGSLYRTLTPAARRTFVRIGYSSRVLDAESAALQGGDEPTSTAREDLTPAAPLPALDSRPGMLTTASPCRADCASAGHLDCVQLHDAIGATCSFAWVLQDEKPIGDSQMETHRIEVLQLLQEARDRMIAGAEIATDRDTDLRA